jgi:hypothetical protein
MNMVRLQPSFRRKKKEWEDEAPADRPREPETKEQPEQDGHPKHPTESGRRDSGGMASGPKEGRRQESPSVRKLQDKKLLAGIVILITAVVLILIILWAYPPQPARPANTLSDSQVRAELEKVKELSTYPNNLKIDPYQYPKVFGTWNDKVLVEQYFCSDVCPDYGRLDLVFQGVDAEQCNSIGGKALRDLAWGGYLGCEPRV